MGTIRSTNAKGETLYLYAEPINVLGEDTVTVAEVETKWVADEANAWDWSGSKLDPPKPRIRYAHQVRDLEQQLEHYRKQQAAEGNDVVVTLPDDMLALPEWGAPAARTAPTVLVVVSETEDGKALREELAEREATKVEDLETAEKELRR